MNYLLGDHISDSSNILTNFHSSTPQKERYIPSRIVQNPQHTRKHTHESTMMMHQSNHADTVMSSSSSMMEVETVGSSSGGSSNRTRSNSNNEDDRALPENYVPGNWDVICQRGKDCHEHIGNRRFRICVENHVDSYLSAKSRLDKSNVISSVVRSIQQSSNHEAGGFIMKVRKKTHHIL